MPASMTDTDLAERIAKGDEQAFELLVRRHSGGLARYCSRTGLPAPYVDDVVQHTLMQLWIALRSGKVLLDPQAWLYRVARNATLNELRRLNRDARDGRADAAQSAVAREHDPERGLIARQALADVAALPAMQRSAVVLSGIEGRPHDEVAALLGVEGGAVRGLLYRARVTLRDAAAAVLPVGLLRRAGAGWPRLAAIAQSSPAGGGAGRVAAITVASVLVAGAAVGPLLGHRSARTPLRAGRAAPAGHRLTAKSPPRHAAAPGAELTALVTSRHRSGGTRRPLAAARPSQGPAPLAAAPVTASAPAPAPASKHVEAVPRPSEAVPVAGRSEPVAAVPAPASHSASATPTTEAPQTTPAKLESPTPAPTEGASGGERSGDDRTSEAESHAGTEQKSDDSAERAPGGAATGGSDDPPGSH